MYFNAQSEDECTGLRLNLRINDPKSYSFVQVVTPVKQNVICFVFLL